MSGVFRPEQNVTIEATDDKVLAVAHGLTEWDAERGQYVAPAVDEAEPVEADGAHLDPSETGETGETVLIGEPGPEVTPEAGEHDDPATGETAHYATPDEDA